MCILISQAEMNSPTHTETLIVYYNHQWDICLTDPLCLIN